MSLIIGLIDFIFHLPLTYWRFRVVKRRLNWLTLKPEEKKGVVRCMVREHRMPTITINEEELHRLKAKAHNCIPPELVDKLSDDAKRMGTHIIISKELGTGDWVIIGSQEEPRMHW